MGKLKTKYDSLYNALQRLEEAVVDFNKFQTNILGEYDVRMYRSFRDSMIKRFEFCVDLFWKYIKVYLEEEMKQVIEISSPKPIIKDACRSKLITESDAEKILTMINDRNRSSHIYKEDIADQISNNIESYYQIMSNYLYKLS